MTNGNLKTIAAAALIGAAALTLSAPAEAGRGYYRHGYGGGWGAGLLGFGIGAIVGSALTPREVYIEPDDDYEPPTDPPLMDPATDRRPGRPSGTPTAPSATVASMRAPAISSAMTACPISASS